MSCRIAAFVDYSISANRVWALQQGDNLAMMDSLRSEDPVVYRGNETSLVVTRNSPGCVPYPALAELCRRPISRPIVSPETNRLVKGSVAGFQADVCFVFKRDIFYTSFIIKKHGKKCNSFSTTFKVGPGQFMRGLPLLRMRLERHFISEKMYRIRNRIDLADFRNAYMVAQNNPDTFLQHSAKEIFGKGGCAVARTGRKSSIVKQRLVDILFSESPLFKLAKGTANEEEVRKSANQLVEDWRRGSKPWSEIIRRFGYGILLFVPSELTDER